MKTISNFVSQLLQREDTKTFAMVKIEKDVILRITSASFDILLNNYGTNENYTADGPIMALDPPRLTSVVDREAYKITLADVNGEFRSLFDAGFVGTKISVRIGFINNGSDLLDSVGNTITAGNPSLDIRDTIAVYSGVVDTTGIVANFNENTNVATIECSSPMGALDMKKAFFTSKDSMRNKNPNDSSFDFVHVSSGASMLLWGKS